MELYAGKTTIDQDRWIIQVRDNLQIEEEEEEVCVSVFNVPKDMLQAKPEAYTPQCVSIGPYHHRRSELNEIEKYKLAAARAFQKRIEGRRFEFVVEELRDSDRRIRSCYNKTLDYSGEALAWLVALDASFLLECLRFLAKQAREEPSEGNPVSKLLDPLGRSATHNAIVRDMMMLENQVPLFVLQKLLETQLGSQETAEERLSNLVRDACIEMSPLLFEVPEGSMLPVTERSHLLEALYFSLVMPACKCDLRDEDEQPLPRNQKSMPRTEAPARNLWNNVSELRVVQHLMKLPFRFMCNLPVLRPFKELLSLVLSCDMPEKEDGGSSPVEIPPTRDELEIPCVADLSSAGVKFVPTHGDVTTLRFDQASATLHLPRMRLDSNTEVIIRNLVAFETSSTQMKIFTRYTDFMNGIIDTDEDVRLLRRSGIICNHLENDGEVASLLNGLGKRV